MAKPRKGDQATEKGQPHGLPLIGKKYSKKKKILLEPQTEKSTHGGRQKGKNGCLQGHGQDASVCHSVVTLQRTRKTRSNRHLLV